MKTNLLSKLQDFEKNAKALQKQQVDINATFAVLTDEEILLVIAHRAKKLRIANNLKQKEFSVNAKLSSPTTYSNFEQTGKVSLLNFVKIIRSLGKIHELEPLLKSTVSSKIDAINNTKKDKKRVR